MVSAKDEMLTQYMRACMDRFSSDDLKFLEEKFWAVSFNFSVDMITTTEVATTDGSMTDALLDYFRIGKLSSGKSPSTIEQYVRAVHQLCDFCHKEMNLITTDDVMYFMVRYKEQNNVKGSTMDVKRKYLSSVFTYLYKHKKIADNPMSIVEPVKYKKCVKVPLSDEEIELLKIHTTNERDLAIVHFLLDTGVRVSELCGISLEDVDFKKYTCKVLGKGNKERTVAFSGKTAMRLNEYLKQRKDIKMNGTYIQYTANTPLFASRKGEPTRLTKCGVETMMRELGKRSGVVRVHPHLLRATFATRLAEKDTDIGVIAKLLGHADLESVNRYVLIDQNKVEAVLRQKGFCS